MTKAKILPIVSLALLAGAAWIVYGRALNAPFVFDDSATVIENYSITRLWPLLGNAKHPGPLNPQHDNTTSGRPLVNLSLAINYQFGQFNPFGYHVFNLIVHVLSAMLLMAIVRRTLSLDYFGGKFVRASGPLALAVALLWALHPLQTETVVYVTQRTELMVGFFYLATMYACLRYWTVDSEADRNTWLALASAACLAGAACKEVMVTAPVVVLLFERTFISGSFPRAWQNSWRLYAGLLLSWGLLLWLNYSAPRSNSAGFHLEVPAYVWWFTQAKVLLMYLKLCVWPWPLAIHYGTPYLETFGAAWPWLAPVAMLGILTLVLLWRRSSVGFVCASVLIILSPTLVVPIVTEVAAERRMYLPLAALLTMAVAAFYLLAQRASSRFRRPAAVTLAAALCLSVVFGTVSARRLAAYQDELTLWRDNLIHHPDDAISYNNLALTLAKMGRPEEAIEQFEKTVRLKPDRAHSNLCALLNYLGRTKEAIEHGELALNINPNAADAHNNLANALAKAGRKQEAIEQYRLALRLKPDYPDAHNNLGFLLFEAGHVEDAIAQYQQALQGNPVHALARSNLGSAFLNTGQPDQAIEQLEDAIRLRPGQVDDEINLGVALAQTGRFEESVAALQEALRLNPNEPRAHSNLGLTLAHLGKWEDAVEHYRKAIELRPDYSYAFANLASVYAQLQRPTEAISTAEKGLELARSQGQQAMAQQIENWLQSYRAELAAGPGGTPTGQTTGSGR